MEQAPDGGIYPLFEGRFSPPAAICALGRALNNPTIRNLTPSFDSICPVHRPDQLQLGFSVRSNSMRQVADIHEIDMIISNNVLSHLADLHVLR